MKKQRLLKLTLEMDLLGDRSTLDELVAKAEAKEANGGNIIATDRSSKMQRWQDIIDTEIDEEDVDMLPYVQFIIKCLIQLSIALKTNFTILH